MSIRKRCTVAFALPARQFLWPVDLAVTATVAELLEQARLVAVARGEDASVPWNSDALGIFGEPCRRTDVPRDGDRVEIYRALINDPRASRRARVRRR
ncbi:MAG TPA: RnfH family protein [Steroidobacteraceae bacterium]|jgi:putative ubiquitin-RnfH superfamily antitoxin RatB of RatAB toxin-antitoxin module|nr:RnfH family protein [Steroidobacteraceae bacterium]